MPQLSIIIPVYNCASFIGKTLDALLAQTYRDIEVICINDGSTDESAAVLYRYAQQDNRICVLSGPNEGPAAARNKGLEKATGRYILFCDSDDWYEPDMCARLYESIEKTGADVVMCQTIFEFEDGYDEEVLRHRLDERYFNPGELPPALAQNRFKANCLLWNKIWRKDIIDRYHIRFPTGCHHEDDAFWYMYGFCAERLFYLKKPLYHYLIRSGSIMDDEARLRIDNKWDRMRIADFVLSFLRQNNLSSRYPAEIYRLFYTQLKACRRFLTPPEIAERVHDINMRLYALFGLPYRLGYYPPELFLFLKPKKTIISVLGLCWNGFRFGVSWGKRRTKYRRRFLRNLFYLSCVKKGVQNDLSELRSEERSRGGHVLDMV